MARAQAGRDRALDIVQSSVTRKPMPRSTAAAMTSHSGTHVMNESRDAAVDTPDGTSLALTVMMRSLAGGIAAANWGLVGCRRATI